jgi:hypothetical protein
MAVVPVGIDAEPRRGSYLYTFEKAVLFVPGGVLEYWSIGALGSGSDACL